MGIGSFSCRKTCKSKIRNGRGKSEQLPKRLEFKKHNNFTRQFQRQKTKLPHRHGEFSSSLSRGCGTCHSKNSPGIKLKKQHVGRWGAQCPGCVVSKQQKVHCGRCSPRSHGDAHPHPRRSWWECPQGCTAGWFARQELTC